MRKIIITTSKAVSHAYCVREFDRSKLGATATQDSKIMREEQQKYDIHFTGVAYDRRYPVIWCGFTSFVGDLLWSFDYRTKKFESKGFMSLREKEEVKIHRGLQVGPDGQVYFGTASLVNIKERHYAPGGRLFRYNPKKNEYEFLGRPIQNDYIQAIDIDHKRGIIYGVTYPIDWFFGWDMEKKKLLMQVYISSSPHQVCVDDSGQCWATYRFFQDSSDARFMKYNPKTGKLIWTDVTLPGDDPRLASIDSFVNGGDGFLYIGTGSGALMRLDPREAKIDMIIKPVIGKWLAALSPPAYNKIYGIAGSKDASQVFSYDLKSGAVVLYGPVYDAKRKTYIHRPHELALGPDNCLYCPETDNPGRQCYFWEMQLQ